jgi:uncharacterized protein (TIGR02246 family)
METFKKVITVLFLIIVICNGITAQKELHSHYLPQTAASTEENSEVIHFMTKPQQEIWQVMREINDTWTKGNPERLVNFFHKNMVTITSGDKRRIEGKDACIASWTKFAKTNTIKYWKESEPRVDVYGDTAVVTYYFNIIYETKGISRQEAGREMFTFIREKGKWCAVASQYSLFPKK